MAIRGADSVQNEPQSAENEVVCFSACFSPANSSVAAMHFHCIVVAVHLITNIGEYISLELSTSPAVGTSL